jgi:hypothetical protein
MKKKIFFIILIDNLLLPYRLCDFLYEAQKEKKKDDKEKGLPS